MARPRLRHLVAELMDARESALRQPALGEFLDAPGEALLQVVLVPRPRRLAVELAPRLRHRVAGSDTLAVESMPSRVRPTSLPALRWDVPGIGVACVMTGTIEHCEHIDASWPSCRFPSDVHHDWRWVQIRPSLAECFVVIADGRPVGIWGSTSSRPINLPGGPYYRLDFLEVHPELRGQIMGAFLIAVVGRRALEVGARGIVLTAFKVPGLVAFYEELGAMCGAPKGWNYPKELVALAFDLPAVERLKELSDALLEEDEA